MTFKIKRKLLFASFLLVTAFFSAYTLRQANPSDPGLRLKKGSRIFLVGNNLCSRMSNYDHFETEMQLRYPDSLLIFRNMCDGGNTPGFRPNAGRESPWAFPGAEKFQTELANNSDSHGFLESEDQWLTRLKADIIIAFFGYSESFAGKEGLENFKSELDAFIKHTLNQKYNGASGPQLAIISPIAFEDLSSKFHLPDGRKENENLLLYSEGMKEVASKNKVLFVDAFSPSQEWYRTTEEFLTIDGSQLTNVGYEKLSRLISDKLFGNIKPASEANRSLVKAAVQEKDWMWLRDFKFPNAVHAYGQRYKPFGPDNYPAEIEKIREMTSIRDEAIWKAAHGEKFDLASADARTKPLAEVKTNYTPSEKNGALQYLTGEEALNKFKMAAGYKIDLFASEKQFPDLAKPVQISFDNKGRLWVATSPTYPHWRPGDPRPNDKLIILEDTDGDGKADKQVTFADNLDLPMGFEFAPEGVYLSQGEELVLLKDTNGDDKADEKVIVLGGFDDHDTHHVISAFCADPSGAIYMGEGLFLHSNVETSYGPARGTWGGFFRYNPNRHHLERTAQVSIPNPWGIAFDEWGENFYSETSSPEVRWMMPSTVKPLYGVFTFKSPDLIEAAHRVRPTSGLEFISSRHFPDQVQGDLLINNTIGFLGTKQHTMEDNGTGYKSRHRQDLINSEDRNFRPVDLEFAPDGSLYIADWHNVLIGHMQHNARDPLRDHLRGRIYRITYPARPLIKPAKVAGATIDELLENLKLPEYRVRYRSRRELRGRKPSEVIARLNSWVLALDKKDPKYEHHLLEALWVGWGLEQVDQNLLRQLLNGKDYRARAAAVRALRYTGYQMKEMESLLLKAAADAHGRVRLEAIVAASWLDKERGMRILNEASKKNLDEWMEDAYKTAVSHLQGQRLPPAQEEVITTELLGKERELYVKGKEIYSREGFCITCHQSDGKGLPSSGFPPLRNSKWVTGSDERLAKVVLNGLYGPLELDNHKYRGDVPMTPFGGMLKDEEVAAVLTFIRNSFGNKAGAVLPEKVKRVRDATKNKVGFYTPEELLKIHPMEK